MKNTNDWKDKPGIVYSTNPNFYEKTEQNFEKKPVLPDEMLLRIELDKRNGKAATLVTDFKGTDEQLKDLAKMLKTKCGSGGSQRDGEILIQGDFRIKIAEILKENGYKIKRIGF
jgi:translation initiation factor 1